MSSGDYETVQIGGAAVVQLMRPAPAEPIVPVVTRRQALRALFEAGLLASVEAAINALSEPARTAARIDWDNATEFRRDFPLLAQLAAAIGLSDAQVDALFVIAATF